jgi:hypothetical protein
MNTINEDQEAVKFEAWVKEHFVMHSEWLREGCGRWRYEKHETLFMWDAWKARAAIASVKGENHEHDQV